MKTRMIPARAFTLVEMLVVVAIIGVLATLAFPQLQKALTKSNQTKSVNNLRNIGVAMAVYLPENDNFFPYECAPDWKTGFWSQTILPYLPKAVRGGWLDVHNTSVYQSPVLMDPLLKNPHHQSLGDYGCNTALFAPTSSSRTVPQVSVTSISQTSSIAMIVTASITYSGAEAGAWYLDPSYTRGSAMVPVPSARGLDGVVTLFVDGHTEIIPEAEFDRNKTALLRLQ